MRAREIIANAYHDTELNALSAYDAVDAIMARLTAAGWRLVAPGELDDETLERAAEVVENLDFGARHDGVVVEICAAIRALKADRRALEGDGRG